jgi:hypothetical protein
MWFGIALLHNEVQVSILFGSLQQTVRLDVSKALRA